MSEAIESSLWKRLRYTPLSDLVHGQVSARLDYKGRIESSGLPARVQLHISRVVRQTRLWRAEKADVADELIAHFADGIKSGTTADQLIQSFGPENTAARLIRRAMKRNRPLSWHVCRAMVRGLLACIGLYALLAVYFFMGQPTPSVNYVAILNKPLEQIPPDQRAWPIYRDVHLTLYDHNDQKAAEQFSAMIQSRPGDADYPVLMTWLENHQPEIDTIHKASALPALGFVFPADGLSGQLLLAPGWRNAATITPTANATNGPYQYLVYQDAYLLCRDVELAAQGSDGKRILRDVADASHVADQLRHSQSYSACFTAIWLREEILKRINDVLVERPQALDNDVLVQLAHLLSKPDTRSALITYETLGILHKDAIQRLYTNWGIGGGHITPFGADTMLKDERPPDPFINTKIGMPMLMIAGPSRWQVIGESERAIETAEANLTRPMRDVAASYSPVDHKLIGNPWSYARNVPLMGLSRISMRQVEAERYLGHRDGIMVGIALELYRRHHDGNYPASLADLQPGLIPSLPDDRITGGSLCYRLIDGKPLVYSVGDDRDDDGGKLCAVETDDPFPRLGHDFTARWVKQTGARDGDWVLYPQPPFPKYPTE